MALYAKFQSQYNSDIDYNRFKSALKFFDKISKIVRCDNREVYLFIGDASDDSYEKRSFDMGILESHFRSEIKKLKDRSRILGFALEGKLKIDNKKIPFVFELKPRVLCGKERFDIRVEILPNKHAEIFEDLIKYKPNLKSLIAQRVKEFNKERSGNENVIKRVILSKHGDEYDNISSWEFLYTIDVTYFLSKIIESSKELSDRLSFGNKLKFSNNILQNDNFGFLLSRYSQQYNVALATGSLSVMPRDPESMNQFISHLSKDLEFVASKVYKKENETINLIDETLSTLT